MIKGGMLSYPNYSCPCSEISLAGAQFASLAYGTYSLARTRRIASQSREAPPVYQHSSGSYYMFSMYDRYWGLGADYSVANFYQWPSTPYAVDPPDCPTGLELRHPDMPASNADWSVTCAPPTPEPPHSPPPPNAPSVAPATLVATSLAPSLASSVPVAAAEPEPSSGSAVSTFVSTAAAVVAAARHLGIPLGSSAATTAVAVCLWGKYARRLHRPATPHVYPGG